MLANRIMNEKIPIYRPPNYTVAGFAALLCFLKQRVQVDWEELMLLFLRELDVQSGALALWQELLMYLHLFGVQKSRQIDVINNARLNPIMETGVLSRTIVPETIGLIVTVPRQSLRPIFLKSLDNIETSLYSILDSCILERRSISTYIHVRPTCLRKINRQ